jgi:hypothetical protein
MTTTVPPFSFTGGAGTDGQPGTGGASPPGPPGPPGEGGPTGNVLYFTHLIDLIFTTKSRFSRTAWKPWRVIILWHLININYFDRL